MAKRIIQLDPPMMIIDWVDCLHTEWRIVAIDVDRGRLHMELLAGAPPKKRVRR